LAKEMRLASLQIPCLNIVPTHAYIRRQNYFPAELTVEGNLEDKISSFYGAWISGHE
jgi:hypothetical protein